MRNRSLFPFGGGDANGDGNVNMKDVLILRKFLAGIITVIDPTA